MSSSSKISCHSLASVKGNVAKSMSVIVPGCRLVLPEGEIVYLREVIY